VKKPSLLQCCLEAKCHNKPLKCTRD